MSLREKIVHFNEMPGSEQLATVLGYGEVGTSEIKINDSEDILSLYPNKFSIKVFCIFMVIIWLSIGVLILAKDNNALTWIIWFLGIFVIPFMAIIFHTLNQAVGDQAYLILINQKTVFLYLGLPKLFQKINLRK